MRPPVTLQVSLAPTDLPYAVHVLPHQLRQWAGQVDDIVLTVDSRPGSGRFGDAWAERAPHMRAFLDEVAALDDRIRVVEIAYDEPTRQRLADRFFGGRPIPLKDHLGGPYYCYFAGLDAARHDLVLHTDSDMFYGGGSPTWVAEAAAVLAGDPAVVACNPLPGPPVADVRLRSQTGEAYTHPSRAFRFPRLSTRVFLVSLTGVADALGPFPVRRPRPRKALLAAMAGNPVTELPELIVSARMAERGRWRVDLLGSEPGMWSLHPRWRSDAFVAALPDLIRRVEAGAVPDEQRGRHDLHDSFFDWGDAPRQHRLRRLRSVLRR